MTGSDSANGDATKEPATHLFGRGEVKAVPFGLIRVLASGRGTLEAPDQVANDLAEIYLKCVALYMALLGRYEEVESAVRAGEREVKELLLVANRRADETSADERAELLIATLEQLIREVRRIITGVSFACALGGVPLPQPRSDEAP